jgi:hypothetical protein
VPGQQRCLSHCWRALWKSSTRAASKGVQLQSQGSTQRADESGLVQFATHGLAAVTPMQRVFADFTQVQRDLSSNTPLAHPRPTSAPAAAASATASSSASLEPGESNASAAAPAAAGTSVSSPGMLTEESPEMMLAMAKVVPPVVVKELPIAGASSKSGTSEVWRQLRNRNSNGQLMGISSHQGSPTSVTLPLSQAAGQRVCLYWMPCMERRPSKCWVLFMVPASKC